MASQGQMWWEPRLADVSSFVYACRSSSPPGLCEVRDSCQKPSQLHKHSGVYVCDRPVVPGLRLLMAGLGSWPMGNPQSLQLGDPGLCDRSGWQGGQCHQLSSELVIIHLPSTDQGRAQRAVITLALLTPELKQG